MNSDPYGNMINLRAFSGIIFTSFSLNLLSERGKLCTYDKIL